MQFFRFVVIFDKRRKLINFSTITRFLSVFYKNGAKFNRFAPLTVIY